MKKALLILICLSFTLLAVPMFSHAFDTYRCGDQEVTIWGFLRNNLGMFERTQEFTDSGNQLATARTWLRAYMDWKMSEQFKFYTAVQFVYEPWYKVEESNAVSSNGGPQQHSKSGWKTYSEFDDINDVIREVYIEWKPSKKHTIKFGRQIAIWGESLTDPVGDVIQPTDRRFTFAFANIEDTRIPQYMIRGIHDIDSLNSSFEWIVNPLLTQGNYTVNRSADYSMGGTEQRFAFHPEDRFYAGRSVAPGSLLFVPFSTIPLTPPRFDYVSSNLRNWYIAANGGDPNAKLGWDLSNLVGWPIASSFYEWIPAAPGTGLWVPNEIPYVHTKYPDNFEDTRFGFRTSTLLGGYQFGFSYWHTQAYDPVVSRGGVGGLTYAGPEAGYLPLREYEISYPTYDIIGFYMNKQLPWPGVIRAEMIYSPNKPYNTFNIVQVPSLMLPFTNSYTAFSNEDCVVRRDYVKYMLAYDLNSFFYFDWHKTAPFDITFEHIGEWVPNSSDLQYVIYNTKIPNYHASFNVRISTNWYYNRLATEVIFGYDTWGNSGLFMPAITWKPGWMNQKFSAELKYIGLYGDNDYEGIGIFRKKDMIVLTTQFNF